MVNIEFLDELKKIDILIIKALKELKYFCDKKVLAAFSYT